MCVWDVAECREKVGAALAIKVKYINNRKRSRFIYSSRSIYSSKYKQTVDTDKHITLGRSFTKGSHGKLNWLLLSEQKDKITAEFIFITV